MGPEPDKPPEPEPDPRTVVITGVGNATIRPFGTPEPAPDPEPDAHLPPEDDRGE